MEELIEKARKGDKEAYTELIKMIEWDLLRIACSELDNNVDEANDVIQETMIRGFRSIRKLKENTSFKQWISKILINECRRYYAKKSRIERLNARSLLNTNFDKFEQVRAVDDKIDFEYAISKLNKDEKTLITLYFANNFTTGEISQILNMNVNTVKSKLLRAEKRIKEILEEEENKNGRE